MNDQVWDDAQFMNDEFDMRPDSPMSVLLDNLATVGKFGACIGCRHIFTSDDDILAHDCK